MGKGVEKRKGNGKEKIGGIWARRERQYLCSFCKKISREIRLDGDYFMLNSLHKALNGEAAEGITYLDVSIESHLMSFAAEESRLDRGSSIKI